MGNECIKTSSCRALDDGIGASRGITQGTDPRWRPGPGIKGMESAHGGAANPYVRVPFHLSALGQASGVRSAQCFALDTLCMQAAEPRARPHLWLEICSLM